MTTHRADPVIITGKDLFTPHLMPASVQNKLDTLARTEDLRFSPCGRYLAIAGFGKNEIAIFEVAETEESETRPLSLTRHTRIVSDCLKQPHGIDFVDDRRLVVANRNGFGEMFELPPNPTETDTLHLSSVATFKKLGFRKKVRWPGSVISIPHGSNRATLLFCNNYKDLISRHEISLSGEMPKITDNRVAVKEELRVPDGIARCPASGTIAVSNHAHHNVVLYQGLDSMMPDARPDCTLTRVDCPHGLRFTSDGQYLLVADAAMPFVHIYERGTGWNGEKRPVAHVRIMDDTLFMTGHSNPEEGGAKGLEIDAKDRFFLLTSEFQVMAIFDLQDILSQI